MSAKKLDPHSQKAAGSRKQCDVVMLGSVDQLDPTLLCPAPIVDGGTLATTLFAAT
ncbi:hypothetical protein E4U54_005771 [Claviceps lovelessii]|nr:hypothetical protein E4U54_005771 [Claviceps lovelessii]